MKKVLIGILIMSFGLSGCTVIIKRGMGAATPIFDSAIDAAMRSKDPLLLEDGAPGMLLLLDGLSNFAPKNRDFLVSLTMFYCAYSMGFIEDVDPDRARVLFATARDYGLKALKMNRKFNKALKKGKSYSEAAKYLKKKDMDALFWTTASWAGWLFLSAQDTEALLDIPKIMALLERSLEIDDRFWLGGPHLFYAAYYSKQPAMMGGGPEKAQKEFDKVEEIVKEEVGPEAEWLIADYFYAKFYATLLKDEELFDKTVEKILNTPDDVIPEMAVVNGMAKIKTRYLLEQKDRYF